jgi:tRNA 2-selenouridine synthase
MSSMKIQIEPTWSGFRTEVGFGNIGLIDLRSPGEFHSGRIPNALNIPLLTDQERHEVGTTYKEEGSSTAVAMGLEMFANKSKDFLADVEGIKASHKQIAVHCARGGMRSKSVAMWLQTMGFEVRLLKGGYKDFRTDVLESLERLGEHNLLVLEGRTGSGKTDLLHALPNDFPKIDMEGIANHRGSTFGDFAIDEKPPTQQNFENELADDYLRLEHHEKIVIEIENRIGTLAVPMTLRNHLSNSPLVLLEREFDDRVARLSKEYATGWRDGDDELFIERCRFIKKYMSTENMEAIQKAVFARDFESATAMLLKYRYDPVYDKGMKKRENNVIIKFNMTHDEAAAIEYVKQQCNWEN